MNKEQFLSAVRQRLAGLPQSDIDRSMDYYAEMIDDRMEDGLTEEEAVAAMGTPEYVASQILMDTPLPKLVKAKAKPSRSLRGWEIALLVLGCPVWLPLLLAAAIVLFAGFVTVWALILSLFLVILALGVSGIACIGAMFAAGFTPNALFAGSAGLILTGVTILLGLASIQAVKGIVWLCKWGIRKIKSQFVKKEDAQ